MSAFAVILHDNEPEANELLRERIKQQFPGDQHFQFSDNVYLVTGERLVDKVTAKLGFDGGDDVFGAVLRLNGSFSGRSWTRLWDWLKAAEEVR